MKFTRALRALSAAKRARFLPLAVVSVVAALVLVTVTGAVTEAPGRDVDRFLDAIARMEKAITEVRDYTCVFTKQERVGGELLPEETIFMKHRGPDVCVYLKWIKEPHLGREAIYCEGRYDGEMQVHEGSGIASWFNLSLDPLGTMAMRSSRRPVTEAGLYNAVRFLIRGFADVRTAAPDERRGFRRVYQSTGERALCAVTVPPGGDDSSGERIARSLVCLHEELHLPTRLETWDEKDRLLGAYSYRDLRLNVGLTDSDFDVSNEAYGF